MQENGHIDQFVWTKYNCTGLSDCPGPSQASNFPFCDNPDTIRFNRCLFALARHCQPRNYYLYYLRHHWNQFKDIKFTLVFVFFFIACRCVFHFFPSFFKYCNNNAFFFCVSRGESSENPFASYHCISSVTWSRRRVFRSCIFIHH